MEHTIGYMKRRFGCIAKELEYSPQMAAKIIITCAALHNFATQRHDIWVEDGTIVNLHNDISQVAQAANFDTTRRLQLARQIRDSIATANFMR